ncbi:MAG: PA2779 family protein [Deltaproteobacteria bacterium]|nr:PA2779 family protein [Deltaproteobacteria bacterium]MBW2680674.1 PA2779 family protein [Deltaproteobacteria bacterium]
MKLLRQKAKPVSVFMTILLLLLAVPYQSAFAAMIGTETVIDMARGQEARDCLNRMMIREDVQTAFTSYGITPLEAKARLDTLSDAEIMRLYNQMEQLPAGGSDLGTAFIAVGVIFVILFITDLLGYTDVFSFTR